MLEEMSTSQFLDWRSYYDSEPFGYDINNYRAGVIAAAVMNSVRGKSSDKVWTDKDFFVDKSSLHTKQSWQDQFNNIQQLQIALNKKENTK